LPHFITKPGIGPKSSAVINGIRRTNLVVKSKGVSVNTIHVPKPMNMTEKINDKSKSNLTELIA
jgi:hypothetical protein